MEEKIAVKLTAEEWNTVRSWYALLVKDGMNEPEDDETIKKLDIQLRK